MRNRRKFYTALLVLAFSLAAPNAVSTAVEPKLSLTFAIDTSGSMRGDKIRQVQNSVSSIVETLDGRAQFSIITFSNDAKILLSSMTQGSEVIRVLNELKPSGNTALYDGLETALKNTQDSKNSVIVVFSDGEDNSSLSTALKARNSSNAFSGQVVLVGLGNSKNLASRLAQIGGYRGQVISVTNISALTEQLNSAIQPAITTTLQITRAKGGGDENGYQPLFLLLLTSTALSVIAAGGLFRLRTARRNNLNLLKAYDSQEKEIEEKSIYFKLLKIPVVSRYVAGEERRLLAAGLKLEVRSWIYLQLALFIGLALFLQISGFTGLFALIFSGLGGFGLSTGYLRIIRNKKAAAFAEELPDVLTIIASSLKSGLSFTQAMTSVAQESQGEVSLQFRRVLAEVQVGRNLIDALQDVADRMDSQDFRWTISALGIQREVGGNLSEILATTSDTIRGRSEIRNEIKALSAEGRMSAYVLVALPLVMLLYLRVTRPESFSLLFSTTPGLVMMSVVGVLMTIGWFWVQKVVKIKLS